MMQNIIRNDVVEMGFGVYSEEEMKALSICKVTSPLSMDSLGNPLPGGLYDVRMGPTGNDQTRGCVTCGLKYAHCPGHPGHVELIQPVYHPLLFPTMFQLLRAKCSYCHKLRMSETREKIYLAKFRLIEMGDIYGIEKLDKMQTPVEMRLDFDGGKVEKSEKGTIVLKDLLDECEAIEKRHKNFVNYITKTKKTIRVEGYCRELMQDLVKTFQKDAVAGRKCENCDAVCYNYRKDGSTKIFRKPMDLKYRRTNAQLKLRSSSALEAEKRIQRKLQREDRRREAKGQDVADNDDIDDSLMDDEEEEDDEADMELVEVEKEKYLVPLEVEAHIRLLWLQHPDTMDFVFGRAFRASSSIYRDPKTGWKLFFVRMLLVAPNRFRPAAKVGELTSEHPQNFHLMKIIELNEKLCVLMHEVHTKGVRDVEETIAKALINGPENEGEDEDDEGLAAAGKKKVTITKVVGQDVLSRLISTLIDLQNGVNCYMDSSKDPNILSSSTGPAGIRQILEKKEGLFRGHMMGKRVNYCCRSVISPDPNLGTNEIGIPLHFAKALHYPTPVNSWNAKHLMQLVINGPHEYPGTNM